MRLPVHIAKSIGAAPSAAPSFVAVAAIRATALPRPAADIGAGVLIAFLSGILFLLLLTQGFQWRWVWEAALPMFAGGAAGGLVYWRLAGRARIPRSGTGGVVDSAASHRAANPPVTE